MSVPARASRPLLPHRAADAGTLEGAIRITRAGTEATLSEADVRAMRESFDSSHCIRLPGLIAADLLAVLLERITRARFEERVHDGIQSNRELWMTEPCLTGVLHVLGNSRPLCELVETVSGRGPIRSFAGRVYRVVPGCGHHDAWHDDMVGDRVVAMSVNLSAEPFEGGVLQIRERATRRIVHEIANTGPGDAIVFRLSSALEHRITEIRGRGAKTAFAGWFRSVPGHPALRGR
jgi:2OG-Fe(II) oxygenase superfamily